MRGRCPTWVKSAVLSAPSSLPVFADKQTLEASVGMSQRCQNRTQASQQLDDYSSTSSARASTVGGIASPSARAVLRLTASSNLFGACTGKSAGGGAVWVGA